MASTVAANRLELLQIADAVARDKSIDKQVVLTAMEEAMHLASKATATTENDIKNWRGNVKKSGFLPAERQWLTELLAAGWVDVVRVPDVPGPYSWWSRRGPRGWSGPRPMRCAGPTMLR